jgi:2-(3-amino-3-carboxypropyl)histidine synthase
LEGKGKAVFIGQGKKTKYVGQILGCDFGAATSIVKKVDAFLFVGSGRFHPLGVAYFTGKKTVAADPYSLKAEMMENKQWEKEKWLRVEKTHDAKNFGVVVCSKQGQKKWKLAEKVKKTLEGQNKKAHFIYMDEITPEKLDYLPFDAFVITACPRIVLDDWKNYKKLVLLSEEI